MSFEVNCPECRKAYTADDKMVGKKIRCRQCTQVFVVEAPEGGSSGSTLGRDASRGMGSARAVAAPVMTRPAPPKAAPAAAIPLRSTSPNPLGLRPSEPQPFPASIALEAWIPLGLCTVSAVWIVTETFSDNHSGAAWAPIVRILAFAAVFFLLAVPAALFATKKTFGRMRRAMPPSPFFRTIATFILPATLAYIFSMLSGTIGFVIGSLVGLAVVAIVFWLLFRLESHETANAYAIAGGAYFGASAIGALLLVLLAMGINQGMTGSSSAKELKENPLGPQFVWTAPAPQVAPLRNGTPDNSSPPIPDQTATTPAPTPPVQPVAPSNPPSSSPQPAVANTDNGNMSSPDPSKTTPADDEIDPSRSKLFGGSGPGTEGDPFVKSIQDAKLPWVRWVFRPSDQGIYEQSLSPLTPSTVVALFRMPGIGGRTIECCRLTPTYRGLGAMPLGDEGVDATATTGRYAIAEDGSALLRLTNSATPKVEVLPFRGAGSTVSLSLPPDFPKSSDAVPANPELLGALPGRRFLVRWTSGDQSGLQVYDFQSSTGKPPLSLKLGQSDWPNVFGVSPDGNTFAIAEREAERTYIVARSLSGATIPPKLFDTADPQDKTQRDCAGIAFSPDGSRLAVLMEHGTDGLVRCWQVAGEHEVASGTCKVPSADELLGQLKGRSFDWVTNGKWLVHGRSMLDAATGAPFGTLTDQVVTAQQMADDHTAYLSYLGIDGHPHIAVVKFNPAALNPAAK